MISSRSFAFGLLALGLLSAPAVAEDPADYTGEWRKSGGSDSNPSNPIFDFEVGGGGLTGRMTNAPQHYEVTVALDMDGDQVTGTNTWTFSKDGSDPEVVEVRWEFTIVDLNTMQGRCEWKDLDERGEVTDSGFDDYTLERVDPQPLPEPEQVPNPSSERIGLVTEGDVEQPFGDDLPALSALAGGWKGPLGPWAVEVDGAGLRLIPVGHSDGVTISLVDDRGTLAGNASLANGETVRVELAWSNDSDTLVGRSEWRDGSGETGWGAIELTRLTRKDGGGSESLGEPIAGEAGSIAGVFKRGDGLYLRLSEVSGSQVEGDLVTREGAIQCRIQLSDSGGLWTGTANWDGVEAKWQLSKDASGGLSGRTEWVDVDGSKIVARGWSDRSFAALQQVR